MLYLKKKKKNWYYLLLVPRYSISLIWGHLCLQAGNGISLKMKENQSVNPVAERCSPSLGRTPKSLLSASPWAADCLSPAVCQGGKKKKRQKQKQTKNLWRSGAPRSLSAIFGASVLRDAGQGKGCWLQLSCTPLLRSPASGSHLVPAAPQSGGRDLPPQWPRPRHEAGGEMAGPAGCIFPPRRRRQSGRYHGDRGGRPGLRGSRLPSAQRRALCCRRPGALQARPTGSPDGPPPLPPRSEQWTGKGGGIKSEGGLRPPPE